MTGNDDYETVACLKPNSYYSKNKINHKIANRLFYMFF